jgi:hypothetical protein
MMKRLLILVLLGLLISSSISPTTAFAGEQATTLVSPEEHLGHRVGADRKLVRWDKIVEYMKLVADGSARVDYREVGQTTHDRPFILLTISDEATLADIETYRGIQKRLYFQDHQPGQDPDSVYSEAQTREIFERGKAVVLITCSIHATEVGAAQMSLELVHHLATSSEPRVKKILENVIFLLVPSLNPDGQTDIVNWYNENLGTEYEAGPTPWLYHPYVGHDNNRDMYMYTQEETKLIGQVLYEEWFPSIWLDEHQMGSMGARIFVMPATDPININVHPLIYRLNGVYGQAQGAALEAAGKVGIIYDQTYTNFWVGAMAWTGWWHNQVGMLTELASVRLATPLDQKMAKLGHVPDGPRPNFRAMRRKMMENPDQPLPPPYDVQPRTNYPRPWLGGKWTLRDIVEYELIASMALLETAADTRSQLLEQIYEVNHSTIAQYLKGQEKGSYEKSLEEGGYVTLPEAVRNDRSTGRVLDGAAGAGGTPYGVLIPTDQHDVPTVHKMLELLDRGGVIVERATSEFQADDKTYPAGTFVIRLAQVFGRYAKDMLEAQTYPEVKPAPNVPAPPPYDVTAWSLGKLMGVETAFVDAPFDAELEVLDGVPDYAGGVVGNGGTFLIDAANNDAFKLVNRLFGGKARIRRARAGFRSGERFSPGTWIIQNVDRREMDSLAKEIGVTVHAGNAPRVPMTDVPKPRIAIYQPWGSNMDEGWTRWLVEDFDFDYTTLHPQDFRAAAPGAVADEHQIPEEARKLWPAHVADRAPSQVVAAPLAQRYDVILFTHQGGDDIVEGDDYPVIPPIYRGGIGEDGLEALRDFVDAGGTVIAMGNATSLFTKHWPLPVRNVVDGLEQDDYLIPGSIVNLQIDTTHPLGWGMPGDSHGYFSRNPVFTLTDGFQSQNASVAARYPNQQLRSSGWVRGADHVTGRAAALQVDFEQGGRIVLLGLRPQHRAQTHATFKLLFNALVMPR